MMTQNSGFFSAQTLRRLFGGTDALLERRVSNLSVAVERRQGPVCAQCGFGTLHMIQNGLPDAGKLRCDRPGCGEITEPNTAAHAA